MTDTPEPSEGQHQLPDPGPLATPNPAVDGPQPDQLPITYADRPTGEASR